MKLLYTNNNIKLMSDNIQKEYNTFVLCDNDKELELLKKSGCKEVSEIYNIEEMKLINNSIDKKVDYVKETSIKLNDKITLLTEKIKELESSNANLSLLIENYSNKFSDIENKTEEISRFYNNLLSLQESLQNKLDNFESVLNDKTTEKVNDFENFVEVVKTQAEFSLNDYKNLDTKLQARYDILLEYAKEFAKESKEYAELSRKWACNQLNVVVDDELYSARHYAEISKNNNK